MWHFYLSLVAADETGLWRIQGARFWEAGGGSARTHPAACCCPQQRMKAKGVPARSWQFPTRRDLSPARTVVEKSTCRHAYNEMHIKAAVSAARDSTRGKDGVVQIRIHPRGHVRVGIGWAPTGGAGHGSPQRTGLDVMWVADRTESPHWHAIAGPSLQKSGSWSMRRTGRLSPCWTS